MQIAVEETMRGVQMSSVCVVTTVHAPFHETLMFVNYHLSIGVDHMYLFFDDPTDAAADALTRRSRVTCVRCDLEYWNSSGSPTHRTVNQRQWLNARAGLDLARRAGFDWIVHMDSDELLYSEKRLGELLAEVPDEVHVLKFPTMEGVVDRFEYHRPFEEISLFKVHPARLGGNLRITPEERTRLSRDAAAFRRKLRWARLLGCASISADGYLRGHTEGKSAVRTSADLEGLGCHQPVPTAKETVRATVADDAWLLHFDCRGFATWKDKWQKLNRPGVVLSPHRRHKVQRFAAISETRDANRLSAFYKELFFVGPYDRFILTRLGLLRRLGLDPMLFNDREEVGSADSIGGALMAEK
jgi:hypothetical protein